MDARRVKEGSIMKYKTGFLSNRWKNYHAVLFSDSKLCWYDEKGDRKPKGCILLKDVIPYICVGFMTDRMPVKRPSVPAGYSIHHLVGIGMDPRADTVHWILFSSDADIESWFAEITKTLPLPNPPPQQPPPPAGNIPPTSGYVPPAKYPDAPPPVQINYPQPVPPGYGSRTSPPPPPAYYNQGSGGGGCGGGGYGRGSGCGGYGGGPTTVVIDRGGGGYGGGSGLGAGLGGAALGLGSGMLLGSLLSYGMGSMWGGHSMMMPSYGGGYGGMGGGYSSYSDNDTNITNNYYNTPDPNATNSDADAGQSQPVGPEAGDMPDYNHEDYGNGQDNFGGGGDYAGNDPYNFGGGDYGGDDYIADLGGGGDFGGLGDGGFDGGDFGGGDY